MSAKRILADVVERLDVAIARSGLGLTRSQVQRLIEQGLVFLNGKYAEPSYRVKPGDEIIITIPEARAISLEPQHIPLNVVYQDEDLLVVDKPAGMAVHPGPGHSSGTLVNALLALCPDLKGIGGELRPGIVHRLDKGTSGLMVVAKTHEAHLALSQQLKERRVKKVYLALVKGTFKTNEGVIQAPIARHPKDRKRMAVVAGGREAVTRYRVVERLKGYTLLEVYPGTGRTHQIRVHLSHVGHPLVGDNVYGGDTRLLGRQFLHASSLGFQHPRTGKWVEFTSALPEELKAVLEALRSE